MSEDRKTGSAFHANERLRLLERMAESRLDVLVIGGGITGAGIALDAASRGMKAGLVEMQDFAAGTSSRSTKLIHGGLRYLKQLEIGVVAEVGKERAVVYENGPHVTTPERMLLPLYQGGTFGKLTTSMALRFYDFLAGVKKDERRSMLSSSATLQREPLLKRNGLKGGGLYVEYRTDDARLTIEVLKKAVSWGALAVNYAKAEELQRGADGKIAGAMVRDRLGGGLFRVEAGVVINATGPWVDEIRESDGSRQGKTLHLTKGVHLVFDGARFPLRQAVYFDTPDGRMVFAIPREGKAYLGTTDTDYIGDMANPAMTREDRDYLLNAVNSMFPTLGLTAADVESSWAGLRPLVHQEGKSPSEISRRDEIFVSPSGLLSIAGGKLTGYRKMAEAVVDRAVKLGQAAGALAFGPSQTRELPISGGETGGSDGFEAYVSEKTAAGMALGLEAADASGLARRYGSNVDVLFGLYPEAIKLAEKHGLPIKLALQLLYAIREEMTVKPVDFFIRRTGLLLFHIKEVRRWKGAALQAMGSLLDWSGSEQESYRRELDHALEAATVPLSD
ncbi:glycerol-3-phosphate dehydrogenase/oxidase [Paenibacillus sp. NPDC057967]|uniref:glycerol-3-phosphate dehydrogenase/oxidase n=1 Tax=Paenibacillus sp. NPDC057967 TaxID=3346293 RepID=UPI0036DBC302